MGTVGTDGAVCGAPAGLLLKSLFQHHPVKCNAFVLLLMWNSPAGLVPPGFLDSEMADEGVSTTEQPPSVEQQSVSTAVRYHNCKSCKRSTARILLRAIHNEQASISSEMQESCERMRVTPAHMTDDTYSCCLFHMHSAACSPGQPTTKTTVQCRA
jgi:hypothetical protein